MIRLKLINSHQQSSKFNLPLLGSFGTVLISFGTKRESRVRKNEARKGRSSEQKREPDFVTVAEFVTQVLRHDGERRNILHSLATQTFATEVRYCALSNLNLADSAVIVQHKAYD